MSMRRPILRPTSLGRMPGGTTASTRSRPPDSRTVCSSTANVMRAPGPEALSSETSSSTKARRQATSNLSSSTRASASPGARSSSAACRVSRSTLATRQLFSSNWNDFNCLNMSCSATKRSKARVSPCGGGVFKFCRPAAASSFARASRLALSSFETSEAQQPAFFARATISMMSRSRRVGAASMRVTPSDRSRCSRSATRRRFAAAAAPPAATAAFSSGGATEP
mmetsp:Transcript_8214/g.26994  ORF Transcript_8214/g.26994 Transcript_8214/m.26994 type:complete len:225 (-) Transcript_8214:164-838(-)